jgi:hypothetical protein
MAEEIKIEQEKKKTTPGILKELPGEDEALLDEFFSLIARIAIRILTNHQSEHNNNGTTNDQGA